MKFMVICSPWRSPPACRNIFNLLFWAYLHIPFLALSYYLYIPGFSFLTQSDGMFVGSLILTLALVFQILLMLLIHVVPFPYESDLVALFVNSVHAGLIISWEAEQKHFGSVSEARLFRTFLKSYWLSCLWKYLQEFIFTHVFCLFPKFWELALSKVLPVTCQ